MLKTLYIRDYAIIDELEVTFDSGLNIITGETGAGKSIMIEALRLILGYRAATEDVRSGSSKAVVEAFFSIEKNDGVHRVLSRHGYDDGDELIVRREVSARGSRAFLNDSPAPVTLLREVGEGLIDLHGQHDHQTLLRPETHIGLLDNAGGLDSLVSDYEVSWQRLKSLIDEITSLRAREDELRRTLEFHEFQLQEINEVDPKKDEIIDLERELKIRENGEQLYDLVTQLHALLYSDTDAIRDQLVRARSMVGRLEEIDSSFALRREELETSIIVVEELSRHLQSYSVDIDFAPEELEGMRERLQGLNGLRKKYGGTLQAVLEHRDRIEQEISLARNYDAAIDSRETELARMREKLGEEAQRISRKRGQVASSVESSVVNILKDLGIEKGSFNVRIDQRTPTSDEQNYLIVESEPLSANARGIDEVEFFVSTNLGEDLKPLARTASGGEISRIMLAMKSILAKNDRLPLLIFDEIDTGVSGRIAQKVGESLRKLADFHQIIAITHLPQIAAMSRNHFVVEKSEKKRRTVTTIRRLDEAERAVEVARLVSGEDVTESGLNAARELIKK